MALLPLVRVTPSMQLVPEHASPRCRTPFELFVAALADSPRRLVSQAAEPQFQQNRKRGWRGMALLALVRVTPSMQWAPELASPRCRTPLALSPRWLTCASLGLAGIWTSAPTKSRAWLA